jgi:hypothetical protein
MTPDYKSHGTTTLLAALTILEGKVIGQRMSRHHHQEFIRFLNVINRDTLAERELHLIVDNYATHKHPKVRIWRERHPRFHAYSRASSISRPPSTDTSPKPTTTPSPSFGPPTRTKSSKKSAAGNKHLSRSASIAVYATKEDSRTARRIATTGDGGRYSPLSASAAVAHHSAGYWLLQKQFDDDSDDCGPSCDRKSDRDSQFVRYWLVATRRVSHRNPSRRRSVVHRIPPSALAPRLF